MHCSELSKTTIGELLNSPETFILYHVLKLNTGRAQLIRTRLIRSST